MFKRIVFGSLVLVLAMGLMGGLVFVPFCFAQESISLTTYYPSPYGVYNELQTNKLAVGDTNESGGLDAGDQPPANGQLYTARSVIYKPQSSLPTSNAREGELVYNDSDNALYLYTGSEWVKQGGGGGGCYVSYPLSKVDEDPPPEVCIEGFTVKGRTFDWSVCCSNNNEACFFQPGAGGCPHGGSRETYGPAYVCCQE